METQTEAASLRDVPRSAPPAEHAGPGEGRSYLPYYALFFVSGIPALLYQIVWERALFTFYGVNIESVTITVTAFMVGLGLGSVAGGRLSAMRKVPLLAAFGAIEIGIGVFGYFSMGLFHRVAALTADASTARTGVISLGLLIVPTLLMGSTLPLLVAYGVRITRNVGQSVGALYAVNTFGSATACWLATVFIMRRFGESGSVRVAALLNFVVGTGALLNWLLRARKAERAAAVSEDAEESTEAHASGNVAEGERAIPFSLGVLLAAVTGFISLAYEIVWYRMYSFATGGSAPSFALVLAAYLGGIGCGSLAVHYFCRRRQGARVSIPVIAGVVLWGGIVGFLVAPGGAMLGTVTAYQRMLALIFVGAGLLGAALPLLSHASIGSREETGRKLSYLYLANIAGSASGSLIVGFVLMNLWGVRTICVLMLALGVGTALALLLARHGRVTRSAVLGVGVALLLVAFSGQLFSEFYGKLLYKTGFHRTLPVRYTVENRSGVILVSGYGEVFGGGIYDGMFNTDLVHDTNRIVRAYAIAGFHPQPTETLMVGLASGSWAQVIAADPRVAHLTIVEINPGYLGLIEKYPQVAPLLHNPKVSIVIDDGRRWLRRNAQRKFDMVVMNTTYNWRANASNLLSVEFLRMMRAHMNRGGILYYNTTDSYEVYATGLTVFPYALRVWNFLAVSDSPIRIERNHWEQILKDYRIDGKPVLDLDRAPDRARLAEALAMTDGVNGGSNVGMEGREGIWRRVQYTRVITDDNMGTEWESAH